MHAELVERRPLPSKEDAKSILFYVAHESFALPGQAGFVLGGLMAGPVTPKEGGGCEQGMQGGHTTHNHHEVTVLPSCTWQCAWWQCGCSLQYKWLPHDSGRNRYWCKLSWLRLLLRTCAVHPHAQYIHMPAHSAWRRCTVQSLPRLLHAWTCVPTQLQLLLVATSITDRM